MSAQFATNDLICVEVAVIGEDSAPHSHSELVHEVVSCCGHRPDMSVSEELQARAFFY